MPTESASSGVFRGVSIGPIGRTTAVFVLLAAFCVPFADLQLLSLDPWGELAKILQGALVPRPMALSILLDAAVQTVAIAVLGVVLAAVAGAALLAFYRLRLVRFACAFVRNIHEVFWALILMQMLGLSAMTGVLALALPYACIFAKVFHDLREESDPQPAAVLPGKPDRVSRFLFAELPILTRQVGVYCLYRLECGLRASAIMGFVGLPTLGFHLETFFSQGQYSEAWAVLYLSFALIATVRWWFRPWLVPVWMVGSIWVIAWTSHVQLENIWRFVTYDIVPAPLIRGEGISELWSWTVMMLSQQILPGIGNTIVLTQMALVLSGGIALASFPAVSEYFFSRRGRWIGHLVLVILRSTPEYIIAFILLLVWGPSMLPAVIALALHNGGIVAHLTGRMSSGLVLREDAARGFDRYGYEIVPRIYPQFLALLFYRWEVVFRETAMLGILGVHTLGFYADAAIADLRIDRAMVIIVVTGLCGMVIEVLSRLIRGRLRLTVSINPTVD